MQTFRCEHYASCVLLDKLTNVMNLKACKKCKMKTSFACVECMKLQSAVAILIHLDACMIKMHSR